MDRRIFKRPIGDLLEYVEKTIMDDSLSVDTLRKYGYDVVLYEDLKNIQSFNQLNLDKGIILYIPVSSKYSGHYVAIWKLGNRIYYFDPTGFSLPKGLKKSDYIVDNNIQKYLYNLCVNWIKLDKGIIDMNDFHKQKNAVNVNTCWRHCLVRLFFKEKSHEEYNDFFRSRCKDITPDMLVCLMTFFIKDEN